MYRMCLPLASASLVDINECGLVGPVDDYNTELALCNDNNNCSY